MKKEVIIALDFSSYEQVVEFLDKFGDEKIFVKVGMELFYSAGLKIIKEIKRRGHKIFLDLKMHDIPNTVKKASAVLSELGADITNLHAGGGIEMMKAAIQGLTKEDGTRPLLIAVTQLTSTSQEQMNNDLGILGDIGDVVIKYAKNAKEAGLDGVVCSPLEAADVKKHCGEDFITVTPGIRFADESKDDQKRIATPSNAGDMGCDYIVVGRSITGAADPVANYKRCVNEFVKGVN
ncbi:orotidine-5'-phosphate decarboxylase [Eubacteriales bacterium OttesenSCG-928-G02]|nr:orotidine-5'-phosphate decarboxylase [Eubacteriales bacterium OttesenSCG-928-G02]